MKKLYLFLSVFILSTSARSQWVTYNITNTQQLCGGLITDIVQKPDGHMWFGTNNGIHEFDPANGLWQNYNSSNYLNSLFVTDVFIDNDNEIWVATNGGGVSNKYSSTGWKKYTAADGLASDFVKGIAQDIGHTLWFATYGGGYFKIKRHCLEDI